MTDNQFFNIFASNSWIMVPKAMLIEIGGVPALALCYMIDKAKYHKSTTIWFDNLDLAAKLSGLPSRHVFNKAVEKLEERGLIHSELKGVPARKHFTIIKETVLHQFETNYQSSFENNSPQFETILQTALEKNDNLSNNTTNNKTTKNNTTASKVFTKFIGEEFIPNYPKKVQVNRIWSQVTELIKVTDTFSVEQYEELCGKIRKHLVAYVKSTEKKFLLAPDNYIAARKWEEDITIPVNKSAKNGAMNDKVNDEYLNFLKSKGL